MMFSVIGVVAELIKRRSHVQDCLESGARDRGKRGKEAATQTPWDSGEAGDTVSPSISSLTRTLLLLHCYQGRGNRAATRTPWEPGGAGRVGTQTITVEIFRCR
jgi:hypothetical protein